MQRIAKLGADRLRVLKALAAGGRVEKRRAYPFPETFHLKRVDVDEAAPKVSELCMSDLIARGLIAPSKPVDLNDPKDADTIDYVITPAGIRAQQLKGIEYEDAQDTLFSDSTGRYEKQWTTSMDVDAA